MASRGLKSLALGAIIALVLLSAGCSADKPESKGDVPVASGSTGYEVPVNAIVPQPVFEGTADTEIDTSCATRGCVFARCQNAHRLKFQVLCGDMAYNYDMPGDGSAICVPVNMGDGSYRFRIMQNTEGNNYVELESASADVTLNSELAPYLIPSQICDYDADSACVAKARELTASAENEGAAVAAICTYVADNIEYDSEKAEVDYTLRRNLKKPAGANPGFVIYHTNYSMIISPEINDRPLFMNGRDDFGLEWELDPNHPELMTHVKPGSEMFDDISDWEDFIHFPSCKDKNWEAAAMRTKAMWTKKNEL